MDEDLELIQRVKNGERDAFSGIIEKYYRSVLNLVYKFYGCEPHEAEDIAQEIFLRIYRSVGQFEGRSSFFTYLYKVTMNLCFKKRKMRGSRVLVSMEEVETHVSAQDDSNSCVERQFEKKELEKIIKNAVQSLPEEQRIVVILNKYQGLTYEEIATTLNITLQAVKSRLHRAKLALKEKLAPLVAD